MKRAVLAAALVAVGFALALAQDVGSLKKKLARAVKADDHKTVEEVLVKMVRAGGAEPVRAIAKIAARVPVGREKLYWKLVTALASFSDNEAMEELGRLILKYSAGGTLGRDVLFAMQKNRSSSAVKALEQVLVSKAPQDMKRLAAEELGSIRTTDSVDALIKGLKKAKGELREIISEVLRLLTGERIAADAKQWEDWWRLQRPHGMPKPSDEATKNGEGFPHTSVEGMDDVRARRKFGLEKLPKPTVLVIHAKVDKGKHAPPNPPYDPCFDRIQDVLQQMQIPHQVILRREFEKPDYKIPEETRVIVINCTQIHEFCVCPFCKAVGSKHNRLFT